VRQLSIPLDGEPSTGEPDAGEPPVRFGGKGGAETRLSYPYRFAACIDMLISIRMFPGGPVSRRAGTRDETFVHTRPVRIRALRFAACIDMLISIRMFPRRARLPTVRNSR
jgi:hypothetical protein